MVSFGAGRPTFGVSSVLVRYLYLNPKTLNTGVYTDARGLIPTRLTCVSVSTQVFIPTIGLTPYGSLFNSPARKHESGFPFCLSVYLSVSMCVSISVLVSRSLCLPFSRPISFSVSVSLYASVSFLCLSLALSLSLSLHTHTGS